MNDIYLDMTRGISGDMFISASYAFMDEAKRDSFRKHARRLEDEFDLNLSIEGLNCAGLDGFMFAWKSEERLERRSGKDTMELIRSSCRRLELSTASEDYASRVINDILCAEADAHGIKVEDVHLHEIGRLSAIANIASAALCLDILELHARGLIGSFISIGEGYIDSVHGRLGIPTPAAAFLLKGMRFRFGPFDGEMATPTGIAIVKNAMRSQSDVLPDAINEGVGFGGKMFGDKRGFVRMFIDADKNRGGE